MTAMLDTVPTVRLEASAAADALAGAIREALDLLAGAGRLRLAAPGGRADLLHTVGDATGGHEEPARWVHTIDRIPLRGRELVASRSWIRRERSRAARCAVLLTHGRTAGRIVVEAALAPGERVQCMPVLPPWRGRVRQSGDHRALIRREMGLPPGVRLVVGVESAAGAVALGDWATRIERRGRTDVRVLRIAGDGSFRRPGLGHHRTSLSLTELLGAADLFVATGQDLSACNPGVSALASGVPVVAATTDSVAELVTSGRNGNVVAPRDDAIADAVAAHLDAAPPLRRPVVLAEGRPSIEELARRLLGVYWQATTAPGWWAR